MTSLEPNVADESTLEPATPLLFLHCIYELSSGEGESVQHFDASWTDRVGSAAAELCKLCGPLLRDAYWESFNLADFTDIDTLWSNREEEAIFFAALPSDERTDPLDDLSGVSRFDGLLALVDYWLHSGSLPKVEFALEQFNLAMEGGLWAADKYAHCSITLKPTRQFFAEILPRLREDDVFKDNQSLIDGLDSEVRQREWPSSRQQLSHALRILGRWTKTLEQD